MPIDSLSLKEKIGQLFMIGFKGTALSDETRKFIEDYHIGFTILFSRNVESIAQVRELTASLHSVGKIPVLVYTDQEGGPIVRFKEMAATAVSAMGLSATGSAANAEMAGRLIGADMHACGIDGVFAPVLDVNVEEDNPVIGIRAFSDQPEAVVEYAQRFAQGLQAAGVLNCGKHYPGHGAARADSHLEIPSIDLSDEYFMRYCFYPFQEMAQKQIDSIMTAHVVFPQIAPEMATFSPFFIRKLLRETAGYRGVVFSDCVEMKAVKDHFTPEQIVYHAIRAGVDVIISSQSPDFQKEMMDALFVNVRNGKISETRIDESLERIFALKAKAKPREGRPEPSVRPHMDTERRLADQSITLLRNRGGVLPIKTKIKTKEKTRILVLEWAEPVTVPSVLDHTGQSMVERVSAEYLENRDFRMLKPSEPLPKELIDRLSRKTGDGNSNYRYDYIIACMYSRSGEKALTQAQSIRKLLELRQDAIVVSLESPYEIKHFPLADTFVVGYGFRQVQVEALFRVLIGAINPSGQLPVEIKYLFPRFYRLSY
ncbi:MAG: beta-N-acetylhexosaminidase [Candidatus Omnitrophota bacterium]